MLPTPATLHIWVLLAAVPDTAAQPWSDLNAPKCVVVQILEPVPDLPNDQAAGQQATVQ
jgi:hypothetical protein